MKIIAFGASSSKKSINKSLAAYAANLLPSASVEVLDLNDYELPLFSEDKENELGKPQLAKDFLAKIEQADGVIVSFAEHNGSYSAAYKNLFDWCSRINPKVYQNKPTTLLSTSPGGRGGATVLATAKDALPRFGAVIKSSFSLANFYDNFDLENNVITNEGIIEQLKSAVLALTDN